jgi:NUMOD4 motif/HNH endonuclease
MQNEIWKPIAGYEGLYNISNMGRVYSERSSRILSPGISEDGYKRIVLSVAGVQKNYSIARTVAFAFIPGYAPGLQVNHIDSNRTNDTPENLEWVTARENQDHACKFGACEHKVLSLDELAAVREERAQGISSLVLGEKYGISDDSIRKATADLGVHLKPQVTAEQIADMRARRARGDTMISIAEALGLGHTVVWRNTHDVLGKGYNAGNLGPKPTPPAKIEAMRLQRWATGDSYQKIAKAHGVSKPTARLYCKDIQVNEMVAA